MTHKIISKADAKARGLTRYFTGVPCTRGHVTKRRVSDTKCIECDANRHRPSRAEYLSQWRAAHPAKVRAHAKTRAAQPRTDATRERQARYYAANRDACRALQAKDRADRKAKRLAAAPAEISSGA